MKKAIQNGILQGFMLLGILCTLFLISVALAEIGRDYPAAIISVYACVFFCIPIAVNIQAHWEKEEKSELTGV